MASAATMSRKRAAAIDNDSSAKRQRFVSAEDEAWSSRSPNQDVDTPAAASSPSSQHSTPLTEREPSNADTSHTSVSTSKRPKRYVCDYEACGKAFDRPIRLQMHVRSHTNERPYPCTEEGCDKAFLRNEHLKAHTKAKHSDERNYVCDYTLRNEDRAEQTCSKAFTTATKLRRHKAMHEEKEQTKCQECGNEFRKQETLQRHIKTDHLNEKAFRCTHVEIGAMEEDKPEECGQEFKNARQLRAHTAREHSGTRYFCQICTSPDVDMDGADVFSVQSSAFGFATYTELQAHTKTAHPPACPTCGKTCESNRALKAHIDIEHTSVSERARYECTHPGCGRKFTKNGNMKVHIQTVHAKAKNFACGEYDLSKSRKVDGWDGVGCGFSFGTKANLEEHVRTQHLGLPGMYKRGKKGKEDAGSSRAVSPGAGGRSASMITGFGYEEARPIACLDQGCVQRFVRNYDLAAHLEMVHGWNVDDVNDQMAEKEALEGGKFWIGGGEEVEAEEDVELRRRLVEGLHLEGDREPAGNGLQDFLDDPQTMGGMERVDPAIDPMLA